MRLQFALLAVFSLLSSLYTQSTPNDIHCNFRFVGGNYFCSLDDVTIITETTPLRFFNVHLPDQNDGTVSGLSTQDTSPRSINIRVVHPQLMQQFPNIRFLHLSESAIETLLTGSFQQCGQLTVLTLSRNQFTSIPPRVFQNCANLRVLDLSANQLTQVDGESFFGLQNLTTLEMGRSTILNSTFQHLTMLQDLSLTNTVAIESNALRHLSRLEGISFNENSLSLSAIQDAINGMSGLITIILSNNGYTTFNFQFFEQFDMLLDFDLNGNALTAIPGNSFRNYPNLMQLRLHSNHISTLSAESFDGLRNLDTLILTNNRLTLLPPNCFSDLGNLRSLDLSNNMITRLNSNSFGCLPLLATFSISNSMEGQGLQEIQRNFFENFPGITRFGGFGNVCFNGVIDMTQVDFSRETVLDVCFSNWDRPAETTTTTAQPTTTMSSIGVAGTGKLWFIVMLIAFKVTGQFM